jgi:hypothetical protein
MLLCGGGGGFVVFEFPWLITWRGNFHIRIILNSRSGKSQSRANPAIPEFPVASGINPTISLPALTTEPGRPNPIIGDIFL